MGLMKAETVIYMEWDEVSRPEYQSKDPVIHKMGKPDIVDLHNRSEN